MTVITRARLLGILAGLALLLLPGSALAHEEPINDNGVMARVNGTLHVGPEERIKTAIVVDGDARIEGAVTGTLFVVHGSAIVSGVVGGGVTVVDGVLELSPTARIGSATLPNSTLLRSDGAVITGSISQQKGYSFASLGWLTSLVSLLIWVSTTLLLLVVGLVFAAIGGPQLATAAHTLTDRPGESVLGAIVLWGALPMLAVLAAVTLIGIPIGLALVAFLVVVWVAGYVVAGARLGTALLRWLGQDTDGHRYRTAIVGLVALQIVGMVPIVGGPVVALAGLLGSGALGVLAWTARGGPARAARRVQASSARTTPAD